MELLGKESRRRWIYAPDIQPADIANDKRLSMLLHNASFFLVL
jgi:hypothetical protein